MREECKASKQILALPSGKRRQYKVKQGNGKIILSVCVPRRHNLGWQQMQKNRQLHAPATLQPGIIARCTPWKGVWVVNRVSLDALKRYFSFRCQEWNHESLTAHLVPSNTNQYRNWMLLSENWGSQSACLKIYVTWYITPCRLVNSHRRFDWSQCLHLQGQTIYKMLVFLKLATLQRQKRSGSLNCIKTIGYRKMHNGNWERQRPRKPTVPL